ITPRATNYSGTSVLGQLADRQQISGWMDVYGAGGSAKEHTGTSGYHYSLVGGVFGVELGSNATQQVGLFYSYGHSAAKTGTTMGRIGIDENVFGSYFRWTDPWGYGMAIADIGTSKYKGTRYQNFGQWQNMLKSEENGWTSHVYLEKGADIQLVNSTLQPFGGLQYTYIRQDAFTEDGVNSDFGITRGSFDHNSLQTVLGIRWNREFYPGGRPLKGFMYANWTHELLNPNAEGYVALSGVGGNAFKVVGNGLGRDWAMFGLGGAWNLNDQIEFFGSTDLQLNEYTSFISGNTGVKFTW
ncbi:MAG: autotransporter outer membrane beta-barrel domain-containing protein, partial [Thermoguttaceae bacterium]|nr:autotransporter outer membrane beta-barrel domain-containing protein [Thermoguttaceae bacterium]